MIRRPFYGGGTAFYGAGCSVTWAFLLPKAAAADGTGESLDDHLARYQPVVLDTLDRLGLGAVRFEGSSDLRFEGRKLGALTAQDMLACDCVGGFINIARPDLDLYLSVARVPDEKFKDKVVKDLREYVVTAEMIAGRPVGYADFRDAMLAALDAAGVGLAPGPLTDDERARLSRNAAKVAADDWVRRIASSRFAESARGGDGGVRQPQGPQALPGRRRRRRRWPGRGRHVRR